MGEERVKLASSQGKDEMRNFVRQLLNDVEALEYMLKNDWFEDDVKCIGAEQEMCLINKHYKPAYKAMDILKDFHPEWLTTELAKFNLELNLSPQVFEGTALSKMETELRDYLNQVDNAASKHDTRILLTGILPSLRKFDLSMDQLTPKPRYHALMTALKMLRGSDYELRLDGIDELNLLHDSPLLEACNTSFQVHLQVAPKNFVKMYNIAQAITGPTLAMCTNSPVLFGKRLWHETRIALFAQSIDNRKSKDHLRHKSARVNFGNQWLDKSILEIYKEDILRYRILLGAEIEQNSLEAIEAGKAPKLQALQVHNGTVYRWNRPCYGISPNGKPHLRIENRVLGAGPTVLDEMASTAFWLGTMEGMADQFDDIRKYMSFDDARDNFMKGARSGMDCKFTWINNQKISARDLTKEILLPIARHGLEKRNIDGADIDRYLGIIEERAKRHMNGSRWILQAYTKFQKETHIDESLTSLTAAIYNNQKQSKPAHEWPLPELNEFHHYNPSQLLVEEFMTTDIFTLQKDDLLEFASSLMDWGDISSMPVEDSKGHLIGLITSTQILKFFAQKGKINADTTVGDIMDHNPYTVTQQMKIVDVIKLMKEHNLKVLPVVKGEELIGLISERNFVNMSKRFIQGMSSNL
ncbi:MULTISPECIES: CBS domain-containing protein [unclassified Aureispira]|uniref:CBS domain-containing protein n=1 Tax=unclassified Aureispira TaxID=2649989 RepID=UPI000698D346|nr:MULTISPECIES: CBS domain-containing protein [unclassified Aureispira]WMX14133.1 CBS domain-containing protein [Aureispira sp. CCB-E]